MLCLDIILLGWTTPYFTTLNCSKHVFAMFGYNFAGLCFAILNKTPLNFTKHYSAILNLVLLCNVWI